MPAAARDADFRTVLPYNPRTAFWYLALKTGSSLRALTHAVFIFFRDTNLTDVLFRLDSRIPGPRIFFQRAAERLYEGDRARNWIDLALTTWPSRVLFPSKRRRTAF